KNLDDSTKLLADYQIPLVVVGNRLSDDNVCSVYIDYAKAVEELTSEYIEKGIKDIVVVEDRRNNNITNDMVEGAKAGFKKHKLHFDNYLEYSNDERSTYKYLRSWFKTHRDTKLMIVSRDSQAFAVLNAARENNIKIPGDMELVCMNDTKYNSMVRPQISGYVVPTYDLGAVAMRVVTKMLKGEEVEDKQKVLGYLLRERETTKQ
ncbi:MAG: substrate-binding domain-containing protein, partial [Erysipelotrichaceae bacterium]|nr:substrate-binding domain-containing protein [Erysipelotrichaceae bacterium]